MMKRIRFAMTMSILLALLTGGAALAQGSGPESVVSILVSPNPVNAGETVTISMEYDNDLSLADDAAVCIYFTTAAEIAGWSANFPDSLETLSATYAKDTSGYCPGTAAYGDFYYFVDDPSFLVQGDIVDFASVVPAVTAGTKTIAFRIYSGADCNDEANDGGADAPGGANCSTLGGNRSRTFTVNVSTTQYVGNTGCGGNTPCQTGVAGLQNAVDALPAAGGTIYVYGAYVADEAAIGSKNITLRPVDSGSSLNAGTCTEGSGYNLVELDGSGNLIVDGVRMVGEGDPGTDCFVGVGVTGSGNLTVQNGAIFDSWYGNGTDAAYGVSITGSGTHSISNATFEDNATGLNIEAGTTTVNNSTFDANSDGGVMVDGGTLMIQNSTLSNTNPGYGLFQYDGTVTLRGNTFSANNNYAFVNDGGTMTAYANNISGNNSSGYQAEASSQAAAAKNWWGSATDENVGPTDGSGSYADGWNRRLGAEVASWAAGPANGTATLGNATLGGGTGTPIIISFGRGSFNAPFGNGVPPYVNRTCSDYYDYYVMGGGGTWTVRLPVDNTTDCTNNVLYPEVAYQIDPATYDTECDTSNNPACWDRIDEGDVLVSGNNLFITRSAADLGYTHFVAGDASGVDPTVVRLENLGAASGRTAWLPLGLGLLAIALGGAGIFLARRKA